MKEDKKKDTSIYSLVNTPCFLQRCKAWRLPVREKAGIMARRPREAFQTPQPNRHSGPDNNQRKSKTGSLGTGIGPV
jgi:hypothetical protein